MLVRSLRSISIFGFCLWGAAGLAWADAVDDAALREVRQAILSAQKNAPDWPLETALAGLPPVFSAADTSFSVSRDDADGSDAPDESLRFLPRTQPAGVSDDEWKALAAYRPEDMDVSSWLSFSLVDLDGDGRRDLIVGTSSEGTGLWSYTFVSRRVGANFEPLFSFALNGRGANQDVTWVRLQGRVYVLYRNSRFGEDRFYFLQPFQSAEQVPVLTLRYSYLLVPRVAGKTPRRPLIMAAGRALNDALKTPPGAEAPICPLPAGLSQEDESAAAWYCQPGHYTVEHLCFPVWQAGRCHVARLEGAFGAYGKADGLYANLNLAVPNSDRPDDADWGANSDYLIRRRLDRIESEVAPPFMGY